MTIGWSFVDVLDVEFIRIATNCSDDQGAFVFNNDRLVALFTQLSDDIHDRNIGAWFLEIGFGGCSGLQPAPFITLADALHWTATQIGVVMSNSEVLSCAATKPKLSRGNTNVASLLANSPSIKSALA